MRIHGFTAALATSVSIVTLATPAHAQERHFNIPAGSLKAALVAYGRQSGRPIIFKAGDVRGVLSPGFRGAATVQTALAAILTNTGLTARTDDSGAIAIINSSSPPSGSINSNGDTGITSENPQSISYPAETDQDIVVTGSRIKGAPSASPVITLTGDDIRKQGSNNLGEALRELPQNFPGGQNPGVITAGGSISNQNQNSSSSVNLRGLGPDATLTLLNGHRLSYGSFVQSVDIGAIPIEALDRVEVVADGSSALYGSDAVGGVVNVLLKPDYEGASIDARFGKSTSGGNKQIQLGAVVGHRWSTGGFIAAYNFEDYDAITAGDRLYTASLSPNTKLVPSINQHSAIAGLHQDLLSNVTFSVDGLYSNRTALTRIDVFGTAYTDRSHDTAFSIAPTLSVKWSNAWSTSLTGVYGRDDSRTVSKSFDPQGAETSSISYCYCNSIRSVELASEGRVAHTGAGDIRVAIGGGYRENSFRYEVDGSGSATTGKQSNVYAYGELLIPVIGPSQNIYAVRRLDVSIAGRWERHPGIGSVFTPKAGLVYSPTPDFDIKGSIGRSFKAPTLLQRYSPQFGYLYRTSSLGVSSYPAGSTAILVFGGDPSLKPETATTWSATLDLHPRVIPGVNIDLSYFNISYRNRVTQPISVFSAALAASTYAQFVQTNPSAGAQQALIDSLGAQFQNLSGSLYNSANTVAIIDDRYVNATSQQLHGIDLSASYRKIPFEGGTVSISATIGWLFSKQRLIATLPPSALAGTIFNPPHLRGRLGLSWEKNSISLSSYLNHIGPVTDNRSANPYEVGSQTTLDMAFILAPNTSRGKSRFGLGLIARNILNSRPATVRTGDSYSVPYDSTNYSPEGRFLSLQLSYKL